ncbi:MAG: agmatinase family protein [Candidatus Hodarchaeales archaeon]|jgi:agmatinase
MNLKKAWDEAEKNAEKIIPQRVERRLKAILHGDVPTFMELPRARTKVDLETVDVAFLGIPWEGLKYPDPWTVLPETAAPAPPNSIYYRTGADKSPEHIRKYSIFYSYNHGWGYFPELERDFIIFNHLKAADYGDVEVDVRDPEKSLGNCLRKVSEIYETGTIPLVAGGDHAIPYPCVQGLAKHAEGDVGIITFDSHFDLYREPEFSAASQWGRLFELPQINPENYCSIGIRGLRNQLHERFVAEELGIQYYTMGDIESHGINNVIAKALEIAGENTDALYVSLDIDVMDPAFCPAQKYPEPNGLTSREIISALRQIGKHQLIKGFDICCLGPQYDTPTGLSAQLCARLFMEVMASIAWQKKRSANPSSKEE